MDQMLPEEEIKTARLLLDTNIISRLMRVPTGLIAARLTQNLQQMEGSQIGTSVIVDCELRLGLAKTHPTNYWRLIG